MFKYIVKQLSLCPFEYEINFVTLRNIGYKQKLAMLPSRMARTAMTTLKDIAAAAGVSLDTVSRVLNGKSKERWARSAQRAEEIREIARRLNYAPNRAAQAMRTKRTFQVGVIVSELYNPFTGRKLEAISDELSNHGYGILLGLIRKADDVDSLKKFMNNFLDGVINLHPEFVTSDLERHVPHIPVTTFNRSRKESPAIFNMREGIQMALQHLWDLDHRKICLVTGPDDPDNVASRIAGYEAFYSRQEMALSPEWVVRTGWKLEDGETAAAAFTQLGCTACIAGSDLLAVGLTSGLREQGLNAPGDYSLVSLEDSLMAHINSPGLTSIRQPLESLVKATVEALIAQIEKREELPFQSFSPALVVRSSTTALTGGKNTTGT